MDKNSSLKAVIEAAGSVSALAAILNVKGPTVHQWLSGKRPVSPRLALVMQARWPALVSVHVLRPDIFGPPSAPVLKIKRR